MVWAGWAGPGEFERWSSRWGAQRSRVIRVGPQAKSRVHAILRRAEAAVLPSLVDNLPNTVIESLMLGVPVVGSTGSSIEELVEPGVTGELVPKGDPRALAAMLVRVWRQMTAVRRGFTWQSPIAHQMRPEVAIQDLLALAELSRHHPLRARSRAR
jgi:glycosyltransferase involved in cell wall biosynthesis